MNDKNLHSSLKEESAAFFSKGKIVWDKSENAVWNEISAKIEAEPKRREVVLSALLKYAAAAVVLIVLSLGAITFLYQKTYTTLPGEQLVAQLPDGSKIELNAVSSLKYYPLKWRFERKVKFEGEAYFEVEKGKKFEVVSKTGITRVVGTSFNIFARDNNYRVTCLTGKVRVSAKSDQSVILTPDSHAEIENGKIILNKNIKPENVVDWINNKFFFPGTPLKEVIGEIERRYAVTIKMQPGIDNRNFAGNFQKMYSVEKVLEFVCKSMQLEFKKQSECVFLIVEKS